MPSNTLICLTVSGHNEWDPGCQSDAQRGEQQVRSPESNLQRAGFGSAGVRLPKCRCSDANR